jgi:signal transduction histidine kinase
VLSALTIAGHELALPLSGSDRLPLGTLAVDEKNLAVRFTSPTLLDSGAVSYQVRFDGDSARWSAPSAVPALQLAQLAPGHYDLQVRATSRTGTFVSPPATLQWNLPAPLWRRGWFMGAMLAIVAGVVVVIVRQRVQRLLAVERIRTRIASDLHDEIGASLTHIALLSDITKRQAASGRADTQAGLDKIASVSRELVDSMSDIVWSINPKRDRLSDLIGRLRWFATELAEPRGVVVTLNARDGENDLSLDPDTRRALYLISKEAIHNALKHSGARALSLDIVRKDNGVEARVTDDGRGFEATAVGQGNGLINMRQRAAAMGGSLELHSTPGKGTSVVLFVPLRPDSRRRKLDA